MSLPLQHDILNIPTNLYRHDTTTWDRDPYIAYATTTPTHALWYSLTYIAHGTLMHPTPHHRNLNCLLSSFAAPSLPTLYTRRRTHT
jgi:hypothetical protein